jgi:hypothetical protein
MKKLILGLLVLLTISNHCLAQKKVTVYDINGKEAGIFINMNDKNEFNEMFLFQYENFDLSIFKKYENITLIESNKNFIKLSCDETIYELSLNPELKSEGINYIYGYGLSYRTGKYSLKLIENPTSISDIILLNGNNVNKALPKCDSGGVGSSECTTNGGVIGTGASCSVKCNKGYHSCCMDAVNECTCRKG